jgi:hypothetical protein
MLAAVTASESCHERSRELAARPSAAAAIVSSRVGFECNKGASHKRLQSDQHALGSAEPRSGTVANAPAAVRPESADLQLATSE